MSRTAQRIVLPLLGAMVITVALEWLLGTLLVPDHFFPRPSVVFEEITINFGHFLPHIGLTFGEAAIGFVVGNIAAFVFAILFSQLRIFRQTFYPLVIAFQAVTILAIAPFVAIWFGTDLLGKAIVAAIICYFPATVILTNALTELNRDAHRFLLSLGASRAEILRYLAIPSAVPAVFSAVQVSSVLCVVGALVAEFSGSDFGAGYLILKASAEYQTKTLFAILALVSMVTFAIYFLVGAVGTKVTKTLGFKYTTSQSL